MELCSVSHNRLFSGRCQMYLCCGNISRYFLGAWEDLSVICLREKLVVARSQMKALIFTPLACAFPAPSCAARARHSKSCSATNVLHCFAPSASAVTWAKQFFLLLISYTHPVAIQIHSCACGAPAMGATKGCFTLGLVLSRHSF